MAITTNIKNTLLFRHFSFITETYQVKGSPVYTWYLASHNYNILRKIHLRILSTLNIRMNAEKNEVVLNFLLSLQNVPLCLQSRGHFACLEVSIHRLKMVGNLQNNSRTSRRIFFRRPLHSSSRRILSSPSIYSHRPRSIYGHLWCCERWRHG